MEYTIIIFSIFALVLTKSIRFTPSPFIIRIKCGLNHSVVRNGEVSVWFKPRLHDMIPAIYEPPRGKTNNVFSDQVRHKSGCTVTE